MQQIRFIVFFISFYSFAQNEKIMTPYEQGNQNQTATYEETIAWFTILAEKFNTVSMRKMGLTDSGEPLHMVTFNPDAEFDFEAINNNKLVLLINNGIHPGEPDGVDATMLLFRDLATGKIEVPKNVVIVNIPIYNIGGALNRGSFSRVNQNGPESYGFRGNARNFDLNRDFVKADTRNARSFAEIFHLVKPDVFIDNHVSNGANYQYTFTYIATHHQKLGPDLGQFWKDEMLPEILSNLKEKNIDAVPYVNIHDEKPDSGFEKFMDLPRYSTGYASMFNTLGTMPETHMLKDYASRVRVTYEFMAESIAYSDKNYSKIKQLRANACKEYIPGSKYTLQWELDATKKSSIPFLGFEGAMKKSDVSGKPRLYYDENKPFNKNIPYYSEYKPVLDVVIPKSYVIPKSWWNVIELLKINNIVMSTLREDTKITVESYRIANYKTASSSYEGHYPHRDVEITATTDDVQFKKGDFLVSTAQPGVKYLLETLEPQAADSFFAWNFFDSILQQKEYFSAYVFEDLAKNLLDTNRTLKSDFEKKKAADSKFAESGEAQLDWIYKHSEYYEKSHMQYPIYRIMQ